MARHEGEPKSGFKEIVKKGGLVAAVVGGALYLVTSSGLGLFLFGAGAYGGVKYLESRDKKH